MTDGRTHERTDGDYNHIPLRLRLGDEKVEFTFISTQWTAIFASIVHVLWNSCDYLIGKYFIILLLRFSSLSFLRHISVEAVLF